MSRHGRTCAAAGNMAAHRYRCCKRMLGHNAGLERPTGWVKSRPPGCSVLGRSIAGTMVGSLKKCWRRSPKGRSQWPGDLVKTEDDAGRLFVRCLLKSRSIRDEFGSATTPQKKTLFPQDVSPAVAKWEPELCSRASDFRTLECGALIRCPNSGYGTLKISMAKRAQLGRGAPPGGGAVLSTKGHYGITRTNHEVTLCEMSRRAPRSKSTHGMPEG
jgi:hypothetical protein